MASQILDGGFSDVPVQSARAFRAALSAMARPGRVYDISGAMPPAPLSPAAGSLLLTLADPGTPVFLAGAHDTPELRAWLIFHTGVPIAPREEAAFAVGTWTELLPLEPYRKGTPEYPDRSATLIVEVATLAASGARLTGPGIETARMLSLPELEPFRRNAALFPRGLDFYFTAGARLAALPRTTKVEAA
ncbi:alpha-D-ribose 1-methylphosphonate 5-triphosphate synthase subunit PhnH [Rhodovulum imhoffii]|uniref:Alpha-D-ribose 1-methylphosphonate 5-triphosphate synthase subunit PhnH n=1 Tax=Rhodovulum imhoffii TaxID=365340 RepID=A0A2T5BPS0_9RHOB|nr:phosphonate C-P lyase system protein PhnH [Rhodovulum imhoffii]MBK5933074.1 phosphonate C-P lyase system protein PhnH [Rhodovulum imhoffii]PTN01070.1 alpha-D-ribose 1-methylphosphonate 5-triphosphate synthase subunit PhnH [Rhodovulum imhoffii]